MPDTDELEFLPSRPPAVVTWFKIYCGLLCLLYLALAGFGCALIVVPSDQLDWEPIEKVLIVMGMIGMGLPLAAACLIPLILRPRSWLWVYDLVVICAGMTSACCAPFSIVLLIFWLKPEVKQYFGAK